jgi:hypothetical protein
LILAITIVASPLRTAFAGASVQDGFRCRLNPADSGLPTKIDTTDTHSVVTPSGNALVVCVFHGEIDGLMQAMRSTGFLCGTYGGLSYGSRVQFKPNGDIVFSCHINGHSPQVTTTTTTDGTTSSTDSTDSSSGASGVSDGSTDGGGGPVTSDAPSEPIDDGTTTTTVGDAPTTDVPPAPTGDGGTSDTPTNTVPPAPTDNPCDGNNGYHGGECDKPGNGNGHGNDH